MYGAAYAYGALLAYLLVGSVLFVALVVFVASVLANHYLAALMPLATYTLYGAALAWAAAIGATLSCSGLGVVLVAHEGADLGAQGAAVEVQRFFATAFKHQVGLDFHGVSLQTRPFIA